MIKKKTFLKEITRNTQRGEDMNEMWVSNLNTQNMNR